MIAGKAFMSIQTLQQPAAAMQFLGVQSLSARPPLLSRSFGPQSMPVDKQSVQAGSQMPAYMFIKTKVTDRKLYMKYIEAAQPIAAKYGRKFLVLSQPVEVLEGSPSAFGLASSSDQWVADYLLVSEWPSADVARNFWSSDEYAAVRKLREGAGEVHVLLAEPLPPVQKQAGPTKE
jgi:uncharacterized protein (DUF1330 family)